MNRLLWLILMVVLLLGCDPVNPPNQFVDVKFDYTNLSIPRKYLLPPLPSSFTPSKGMDKDSGGALLNIPLQDLSYDVGMGINFHYNLTFLLTPISAIHSPNELPSFILDAWNGLGVYEIEFDEAVQLYRAYATKYKRTWQYFKSYPSSNIFSVEEWVAGCDLSSTTTDLSDFSSITCRTLFIYEDIYVQMSFSGEYLHLMEEFKIKIENLFKSWER
jgi:hypothetical protein